MQVTESQLAEIFDARGGCDAGSHGDPAGSCCVLEAIGLLSHPSRMADDPEDHGIRSWDIRPLNDAPWSTPQVRAKWMAKLGAAYAGSRDWPAAKQRRVARRIVIGTVSRIIAEMPGLPETVRAQCRAAKTIKEAAAKAWEAMAEAADNTLITACEIWLDAVTQEAP